MMSLKGLVCVIFLWAPALAQNLCRSLNSTLDHTPASLCKTVEQLACCSLPNGQGTRDCTTYDQPYLGCTSGRSPWCCVNSSAYWNPFACAIRSFKLRSDIDEKKIKW